MIEMPQYLNPISLIPGGCPQFLDYEAFPDQIEKIRYAFAEVVDEKEKDKIWLRAFRRDSENEYVDQMDPAKQPIAFDYEINGLKSLEPWLDQWLPLPFLRVKAANWPGTDEPRFEYGPTNWARGRLSKSPEKPGAYRLVLAFEMHVEDKKDENYTALTKSDVDANAQFQLAWRFRDNAWFMDLAWVDEWLAELWGQWRKKKGIKKEEEYKFTYLASYLTFLEVIERFSGKCSVKVVNPDAGGHIDVDLVLDIGNSRTTGILVESQSQSSASLKNSYLLQLRDIDAPENIYVDPFETRVEFSEAFFGNNALNLRSGRKYPAFTWPSPVRIGPEAARLATQSRCEEGSTGMSSPKRYLWDERNWLRTWRFNTKSEKAPYVTRGPLARQINSSGTPLCCMEDKAIKNNKNFRSQERESAFESLFTRSSLMMFLLVEIIHQALLTINSPGQRLRRDLPGLPRRLRRILFSLPSGMPMAERKIYKRWALWAVRALWEALGWSEYYHDPNAKISKNANRDYRDSPDIKCDWDEATCTQIVFLYNEIRINYQGDARLFCELLGKTRNFSDVPSPSIRIATIDIGGGTTDLAITTFQLSNPDSSTPRLIAHPEFHDGFNLAGDDILRAVVADHVLPAISEALKKAGIAEPAGAMASLFGRALMDSPQAFLNKRIQFCRQIAAPVGLYLLHLYEAAPEKLEDNKLSITLGDCFAIAEDAQSWKSDPDAEKFPPPSEQAKSYLADFLAKECGVCDFNVLSIPVEIDLSAIDESVRAALKEVLANLCEVINLYGCDALLLTGRPSRWPGVINTIVSCMPVPPSRIFPMADYKVGSWYPFSDAQGNLTDPKTTVVTGAILASLAEGQLEGFSFDPSNLGLSSTARYIGEMELNGQIKQGKVWFETDPIANTVARDTKTIIFGGPISVGFRQLEPERWTTTRYYMLDYANPQMPLPQDMKLPLNVKLKFLLPENDDENTARDEGEFEIMDITDATGESASTGLLEMRLQTLPREEGFWLDTGTIYAD